MSGGNIIIIKKRKANHSAPHGGAWKVAFADFMTAMMAFFLVMWLISQNAITKQAIAAYFRDPGAFESTAGSILKGGGGTGSLDGTPAATKALIDEAQRKALQQAGERIRQELAKQGGWKGLDKQVTVQVTKDGLRIELVDTDESMFFDTGSAHVKPETKRVLALIAVELGRLGKAVILEGHTDSRPYAGDQSYSNWDLSADRANAARRIMQVAGLHPDQVRSVRGYADRELRIANAPFDARNRRVSIVVPFDYTTALLKGGQGIAPAAIPAPTSGFGSGSRPAP